MFFLLIIVAVSLVLVSVRMSFEIEYLKDNKSQIFKFRIYKEILNFKFRLFILNANVNKSKHSSRKINKNKRHDTSKGSNKYEGKEIIDFIERFLHFFKANRYVINKALKYLENKIMLDNIELRLDFGFGDAAITGITVGVIWALVCNILSLLSRHFIINNKDISINPDFNNTKLNVSFRGIFELRIVHIMIVALLILNVLLKFILFKSRKRQKNKKGGALYV